MSSLTDLAKQTYRDFQVDGVPASEAHEPEKPEIRSLWAQAEIKIAAAAVGDLEAAEDLLLPLVAEATASADRSEAAATDAEETADALAPEIGRGARAALAIEGLSPIVAFRRLDDTDLTEQSLGDSYGTGHYGWAISKQLSEAGFLDAVDVETQDLDATALTVRATVYKLPADLVNFPVPVDLAAYEQLSVTETPAVDVLEPRRTASDVIGARIPLAGKHLAAGARVLILIQFVTAGGGFAEINFGRAVLVDASEASWLRGLYTDSATAPLTMAIPPAGSRVWGRLVVRTAQALPKTLLGVSGAHADRVVPAIQTRWMGSQSWPAGDGFSEWAVAFRPQHSFRVEAFCPVIRDINLATHVHCRVYRRMASLRLTTPPGYDTRDEFLFKASLPVGDIVASPASPEFQPMTLPISDLGTIEPTYVYLVNWSATNGTSPVGVGLATGDSGPSGAGVDPVNVWFSLGGARTLVGSDQRAAFTVKEKSARLEFGPMPVVETVRSASPTRRQSGRSLAVPGCEIARYGGALTVLPRTIAITDIAPETITETKTVEAFNGATVWASRRYLTALTVKIGGVTQANGSDYGFNAKTGLVQMFVGSPPYDVELTFTGYKSRYDLIWADPVTGEIGVTEGTARGRDPEEYLPVLPAGKVAVWHVHVTPGAMELIPVHRFRNMIEIGREAEFQAIREHNLRCLPGLAKRMRAGTAFGLLGTGDSITEISDAAEPEQQLVANTGRDGIRYLQGAIPSDTIAANVPRFNEDGTPNSSGPIIHIGWSYALEAAIKARSACAVSYFNLGIGGTTAATTLVNGLYNGGHPDRIAAAIATGAKLAVIAFGMNQLGDPAIFSQMVAIVSAFKAAGMECVILTVPGTNVFGPWGDATAIDKWQATNDHLVRAALATDTAYVPLHMITGVDQEGALGISRESFSSANALNHDGPYVMKKLGDFLAMMVTP